MHKERRIVWWNSGVAPPIYPTKKKPIISGKRSIADAVSVLNCMDAEYCDLIFLAEINDQELSSIEMQSFAALKGYSIASLYKEDGKTKWDIAILYKSSSFKAIDVAYLTKGIFSKTKKMAIKVDAIYHGVAIRFLLSHFPSQRTSDQEKTNIILDLIQYSSASYNEEFSQVAMIGDYNIDLCSPNIINFISRSRLLTLKNGTPYAPMIKHIGEKYSTSQDVAISGTYFIEKKWKMIDFALFSRNFLAPNSHIQLDDQQCGIWDQIIPTQDIELDHLPIYFTMKWS